MQVRGLTRLSPLAAAVAIGFEPACALAQQTPEPNRYGYGPYMMMDWSGWGYGMIFGPLFMILVLVVVIVAAVVVVRGVSGPLYFAHPPQPPKLGSTALDILKERYARGEIDKNEYEERRHVLGE
jgi:putative membrane protein